MGTNMKAAQNLLFSETGLRASNFKMFPGSSREVTVERIAEEIAASVSRISGADAKAVEFLDLD